MNGYDQGAITGGIGQGLQQASANILNLYGLQQRFDLQRQRLAIDKQYADSYEQDAETRKRRSQLQYFGSPHHWDPANLSQFHDSTGRGPTPGGIGTPQAMRLGVDATLQADPRYLQPGADALLY